MFRPHDRRPWYMAPVDFDADTVRIAAHLLLVGYSPGTVLAWLAEQ